MERPVYKHERPIDRDLYRDIRLRLGDEDLKGSSVEVSLTDGSIVKAPAGSAIAFELLEGPQIVNVFSWSSTDPDERYWAEETMLIEGSNIQRYTRLWGTMARFRPLVTVIEDTVITLRRQGSPQAFHHFVHGGSGTPADWAARNGKTGVRSSWERLTDAMRQEGIQPDQLTENVSLFQKTAIEPIAQIINILPSDALAGDRIIWFAEIDLTLAVALSPYGAGGIPVADLDGTTRAVKVTIQHDVASPPGWPYDGVPYPDLSLYHGSDGRRDPAIGRTPGIPTGGA